MKLSVAKTAGFCMGVQRAVEMALDASNTCSPPIYTYGPLIHNPQVLSLLEEKGITVLDTIPESGSGTVLIRAHGVPPDARLRLEEAGFTVIDATCPRVIKVQAIIRKHTREGYTCIIIGDADHPEVIGLLGYAGDKGFVVGSLQELEALPEFDRAIIVAQTTQNTLFYEAVKKWSARSRRKYKVFDTICDSTEHRQEEAKRLAETVEAVVVVGGHNSGNTQRLAEIVRDAGKPAYHIETEGELDISALASVRHIGITAGASTPNWIIKRIYKAIETLPISGETEWKKRRFAAQRYLLLSNTYVAMGAGFLCYACIRLQDLRHSVPYIAISMLYILSMHTLNTLTGLREARYNDPDRAAFYDTNKFMLTLLALISGAIGLGTAAGMGMLPFLILFMMSAMGLCYNLKLIPDAVEGVRYRRLRDIPGSKTVLIALAWGVVTAIFPCLAVAGTIKASTIPAFMWAAGIVFVRTAFFNILDMQGDRIVGKETIPILLGKNRSMTLLRFILLFTLVLLFGASSYHLIPNLGIGLMLCPVFLLIVISANKRGHMMPGVRLEFLVESNFILAGLITLIWSLFFR
ncbi:4-hydroxy-3-methylbut-2-enyl diphosphate reducta se [Desulfonema ishimotonii]|uniref:4-hydroxy-3-methylbut-2-enyl diphosphate reductase n=1 Tax=Desulfonema ishimotonii TaxID=45657 RepID=A0A401G4E2_9BACT|nr:4-hydroxy-3-methylbut-2-enyl diphosphate reductase [Desulfonema ishimotonii]GBC64102.1 4-hydroxy-3-methylbut-2-enyl diphosphate reducta se [Desulfonema ishimotonii]